MGVNYRAAAVLSLVSSLAIVAACSEDSTTTTTTTTTTESVADEPPSESESSAPTLRSLRQAVLGAERTAYFDVSVLECVKPNFTPVSEAEACLRQVERWLDELHGQGWPIKACFPFYRFVCIPRETGVEYDCREVLRGFSGGQTVIVSRYADPLNLDDDRDGVGCEPYP